MKIDETIMHDEVQKIDDSVDFDVLPTCGGNLGCQWNTCYLCYGAGC